MRFCVQALLRPMESLSLTLACPHCHQDLEIRLDCEPMPDGFHLEMGRQHCCHCNRDLLLYASRANRRFIEFRLVDPSREWTLEEILKQEG
jgi:hypothetical protein